MCRIWLCEKPSQLLFSHIYNTFVNLDIANGGDGIGIAWYMNGQPIIQKGQHITPYRAARIAHSLSVPVMVHFRKASAGTERKDFVCHPFETRSGLLCQNGGVPELARTGAASDTYVIRQLVNHKGFLETESFLENYGILALLRPRGSKPHTEKIPYGIPEFVVRQSNGGKNRRSYRTFEHLYVPCKPFKKNGEVRDSVYVGISDAECMRESWQDVYNVETETEFEEVNDQEPMVMVEVTRKEYQEFTGEKAPWADKAAKGILAVPVEYIEEFGLTPITLSKPKVKKVQPTVRDTKGNVKVLLDKTSSPVGK